MDVSIPQMWAVLTIILLWVVYRYRSFYSQLPPGPWGLPILGYLPFLNPQDTYLQLAGMAAKYGPVFSIQLGGVFAVVLSDANLVKEVFSKEDFTFRADLYVTHGIMEGYGLIVSEGQRWKTHRKFVVRCLNEFGMVKIGPKRALMERRIHVGVDNFLRMIEASQGSPIDPHHTLLHTVGNVINDILFGRTWQEDDPKWQWLLSLAEEGIKHVGVAGPVNFLPILRFLPMYKRVFQYLMDGKIATHEYYQQIIEEHDPEKTDDIIGAYLVEARSNPGLYCMRQLHHLIGDLFGASLDTTTILMRWFLLIMALEQDVQDKLRAEITAISTTATKVTLDEISEMSYLAACVNETHRYRTIVTLGIPHANRVPSRVRGYLIPANTMVIPFLHAIHSSGNYHPEPHKFNPDRFMGVKIPSQFIPFQVGKRMCMGGELARMMSTLFLANLIKRFKVTYEDEAEILAAKRGEFGLTLQPGPHRLRFTPLTAP